MADHELQWRVHRLRAGARLPTRAHPGDAGWDLCYCAPEAQDDRPPTLKRAGDLHFMECPTGLAMAFSPGWVFKIEARSGLASRHGVSVLAGVVDSGYRGELVVLLRVPVVVEDGRVRCALSIAHGDRVAQGLFLPVPPVLPVEVESADQLPQSVRGAGGWGSSGR